MSRHCWLTVRVAGAIVAIASVTESVSAAITFVPGDYYSSNYFSNTVTQYDLAGNVVGSSTMPNEVRGIAFGPDGFLYETQVGNNNNGFNVVALNSSGAIQQTYSGNVYIFGDISYGKVTVDQQYLYVAGQDQLTRFLLGNPASGTAIYMNNQVYDSVLLPNGNLMVASASQIQEITNAGAVVRTLPLVGPEGLALNDIRGIAYNPVTNDLFVTELGYTRAPFELLRYHATTGALEKSTTFIYGDDIQLTTSGALLVGSRTQDPTFFDENLNAIGTLHGGQQMFVTQLVPEPSTLVLLGLAMFALLLFCLRRVRPNV